MKDYLKRHEDKELGRTTGPQPSINPFRDRTEGDTPGSFGMVLPGGDSGRSSGQMILVMLLRLRQCCCHLSLMKEVRIGIGLDLIKLILHVNILHQKKKPIDCIHLLFSIFMEFLCNDYGMMSYFEIFLRFNVWSMLYFFIVRCLRPQSLFPTSPKSYRSWTKLKCKKNSS